MHKNVLQVFLQLKYQVASKATVGIFSVAQTPDGDHWQFSPQRCVRLRSRWWRGGVLLHLLTFTCYFKACPLQGVMEVEWV